MDKLTEKLALAGQHINVNWDEDHIENGLARLHKKRRQRTITRTIVSSTFIIIMALIVFLLDQNHEFNQSNNTSKILLQGVSSQYLSNAWDSGYDYGFYIDHDSSGITLSDWNGSYTKTPWLNVPSQGPVALKRDTHVTGSLIVQNGTLAQEAEGGNHQFLQNTNALSEFKGNTVEYNQSNDTSVIRQMASSTEMYLEAWSGSAYDNVVQIKLDDTSFKMQDGFGPSTFLEVEPSQPVTIQRNAVVNGDLNVNSENIVQENSGGIHRIAQNQQFASQFRGNAFEYNESNQTSKILLQAESTQYLSNAWSSSYDYGFYIDHDDSGVTFSDWDGGYSKTPWMNVPSQGSVNIKRALKLDAQDPLPAGALGELAVSGSSLYFHNGSSWQTIV